MIFKRKENNKKIGNIIKKNGLKAVRDINKIDGKIYKIKRKVKKAQEKQYKLFSKLFFYKKFRPKKALKAFYKIKPKITGLKEQVKELNKQIIILDKKAKKTESPRMLFYSYYFDFNKLSDKNNTKHELKSELKETNKKHVYKPLFCA